jgi:hypothetical protein
MSTDVAASFTCHKALTSDPGAGDLEGLCQLHHPSPAQTG